jgi:hypothetical protein
MVYRPSLLHRAQRHPGLLVLRERSPVARLQPPPRPAPCRWNEEILLAQQLGPDADEEGGVEVGQVAVDSCIPQYLSALASSVNDP